MWKTLKSSLASIVSTTKTRQIKTMQAANEANWVLLTGQSLQALPMSNMLQLAFSSGAPCPLELVLVQTCDFADHAGKVHKGLEFAFNVLHVARQVITGACEAQTVADETKSKCPVPFVVLNPVVQMQFDAATLQIFEDALKQGFKALGPRGLKDVWSSLSGFFVLAGWLAYGAAHAASFDSSDASAVSGADLSNWLTQASNAFFLASGAADLIDSKFQPGTVSEFALYQSTVYGPVTPVAWYAYNGLTQAKRLMSLLHSHWSSAKAAANKKDQSNNNNNNTPQPFDVEVARATNSVERGRAAELILDAPPAYNANTLAQLQRHCKTLRTTCSYDNN